MDTQIYNFSSILTRDVFKISNQDQNAYRKCARKMMVLFIIVTTSLALFLFDLVNILMGLFSFYSVLGVVYITALIRTVKNMTNNKKVDYLITGTVLLSFLVFLPLFLLEKFSEHYGYMIVAPSVAVTGALLTFILSGLQKNAKKSKTD